MTATTLSNRQISFPSRLSSSNSTISTVHTLHIHYQDTSPEPDNIDDNDILQQQQLQYNNIYQLNNNHDNKQSLPVVLFNEQHITELNNQLSLCTKYIEQLQYELNTIKQERDTLLLQQQQQQQNNNSHNDINNIKQDVADDDNINEQLQHTVQSYKQQLTAAKRKINDLSEQNNELQQSLELTIEQYDKVTNNILTSNTDYVHTDAKPKTSSYSDTLWSILLAVVVLYIFIRLLNSGNTTTPTYNDRVILNNQIYSNNNLQYS